VDYRKRCDREGEWDDARVDDPQVGRTMHFKVGRDDTTQVLWGEGGRSDGMESRDRIGARVCDPIFERLDAVFSRNVLVDELLANRLRVHPLVEPRRGDRMEHNIYRMFV